MDILVNVAAVQSYGYFDQLPWEHITRTFDVNCFGYMRFARAVLPHFRQQGSGHILNVQSMLVQGRRAAAVGVHGVQARHARVGEVPGDWSCAARASTSPTCWCPRWPRRCSTTRPRSSAWRPCRCRPPTSRTWWPARWCGARAGRGGPRCPCSSRAGSSSGSNGGMPQVGKWVLCHFGARMQMREKPVDRPEGNLFVPVAQGVGPRGSVPPTPAGSASPPPRPGGAGGRAARRRGAGSARAGPGGALSRAGVTGAAAGGPGCPRARGSARC